MLWCIVCWEKSYGNQHNEESNGKKSKLGLYKDLGGIYGNAKTTGTSILKHP